MTNRPTPTGNPSWASFEAAAPELAAHGRRLLERNGIVQGLLATVADDAPPRIHPIWLAIVEGRLWAFIATSAKRRDLDRDGRYALHSLVGPDDLDEFSIRGHATPIADPGLRARIAAAWPFTPDDTYGLFELGVTSALFGHRPDADAWPPRYTSWRAGEPTPGPTRP